MIRNNRPYSIENGYIDETLITEKDEATIAAVSEWIKNNIRPAKKILQGRTSYGMKHILEHDTGIYLTNNEFKDAMMLAGYNPVSPNELNWRYRIVLTRELNENPSPFFIWAKQWKKEASPCGDFVRDMLHDFNFPTAAEFNFPTAAEHTVILNYLRRIGACCGAIKAFEELWRGYERKNN